MFWKSKGKNVKCELCPRNCIIPEGEVGFCRVRKNIDGKLYSLVYGRVASTAIDPIFKKPFYHFAPGSYNLSIATVGCNWRCKFCCNWFLSQEWKEVYGEEYTPESIVELAKRYNLQGVCFTYIEPTVFYEFMLDVAKVARKEGLYTCMVSNGYINIEPIKLLSKYLDAVVVDFKASANKKALRELSMVPDPAPIFDALLEYKKNKVYTEITDLIIPGWTTEDDTKKLVKWIKNNLGENTPIHFIRFFPEYKMKDAQFTDIKDLKRSYDIAKNLGMKYVYIGNIENKYDNTYCPYCGELLIKRSGFSLLEFNLTRDLKCPNCGRKVMMKGTKWIPEKLWKK